MSLVSGDYVTVSVPDLVANSKGLTVPFQYYNNGAIARDYGNYGNYMVTKLDGVYIYSIKGNEFTVSFPEATIKSGGEKDPTIYIPITLYA